MTNAFQIPKKSGVVEGNRKIFTRTPQHYPRNMQPIALPGSSKFPEPKMMEKKK